MALLFSVLISCSSSSSYALPDDAVIRYGENGTPTSIKGENLSAVLEDDANFRNLQKKGLYGDIAYAFIQSQTRLFKLDEPRKELEVTQEKTDSLHYKHVKFQQVIDGIPVWGRELSVHLNQKNQVYLFQGHYEPTLKNVETTAKLSAQAAAEIAVAANGDKGWRARDNKLYLFMVDPGTPRLAYRITVVRGLLDREFYFVDAVDGRILHRISGKQTK
jgi:Zn-dependent metalloprotease